MYKIYLYNIYHIYYNFIIYKTKNLYKKIFHLDLFKNYF